MNINTVHTLSGSTVFSESVDSGWQVSFYGAAGQLLEAQDSRRSIKRVEYDGYLRVQAIFEQAVDQSMRASERFEYAGNDDSAHAHNRAGQLWRHDDTAGSCWLEDYSLGGDVMNQRLRFLVSIEPPDWPVAQSDRDELLEAGPGFVTSSRFSGSGESVEQTDAAGNKRRYTLTVDGALKSVWLQLSGGSEQVLADNIDYSASGQVLTETAGNAVVTLNRYDEQTGLLSQTRSVRSDGSPLQNLSYEYDPHANIVRMIDGLTLRRIPRRQVLDDACNYEYDTLYQLIRATGTEVNSVACGPELPGFQSPVDPNDRVSYTRTFEYDAAGNLQKMAHVGGNSFTRQMVTAPYSNRSLPDDEPCPGPEHFDPRGNLLILQPGQAMEWDVRNQLARVASVVREEGEDDQEQYVYDGGGQRVRKICTRHASQVVHRDETRYLPGLEIRTHSATGESLHIISVQAAGFGVRVLHWLQGRPSDISQDQLRYSLSDHGGSITQELDDQGQLISQEGYYPFGGTCWWAGRNATEANYKTIRYSAKERDATGLYYYGYRYYAPWLFRWINPDPAGIVDGLNGYGFVHNDPVNHFDEQGLITKGNAEKLHKYLLTKVADKKYDKSNRSALLVKANTYAHSKGMNATGEEVGLITDAAYAGQDPIVFMNNHAIKQAEAQAAADHRKYKSGMKALDKQRKANERDRQKQQQVDSELDTRAIHANFTAGGAAAITYEASKSVLGTKGRTFQAPSSGRPDPVAVLRNGDSVDFFKNDEQFKRRIRYFSKLSDSALAKAFNESLAPPKRATVYRGIAPSPGLAQRAATGDARVMAGSFLCVSPSRAYASEYAGEDGILLTIDAQTSPIATPFEKDTVQVIHPGTVFEIRGNGNRFTLTQVSGGRRPSFLI